MKLQYVILLVLTACAVNTNALDLKYQPVPEINQSVVVYEFSDNFYYFSIPVEQDILHFEKSWTITESAVKLRENTNRAVFGGAVIAKFAEDHPDLKIVSILGFVGTADMTATTYGFYIQCEPKTRLTT